MHGRIVDVDEDRPPARRWAHPRKFDRCGMGGCMVRVPDATAHRLPAGRRRSAAAATAATPDPRGWSSPADRGVPTGRRRRHRRAPSHVNAADTTYGRSAEWTMRTMEMERPWHNGLPGTGRRTRSRRLSLRHFPPRRVSDSTREDIDVFQIWGMWNRGPGSTVAWNHRQRCPPTPLDRREHVHVDGGGVEPLSSHDPPWGGVVRTIQVVSGV